MARYMEIKKTALAVFSKHLKIKIISIPDFVPSSGWPVHRQLVPEIFSNDHRRHFLGSKLLKIDQT